MCDQPTHNLGILGQPNPQALSHAIKLFKSCDGPDGDGELTEEEFVKVWQDILMTHNFKHFQGCLEDQDLMDKLEHIVQQCMVGQEGK